MAGGAEVSFFDSLERGEDMPLPSLAVALKSHLAVLAAFTIRIWPGFRDRQTERCGRNES